MGMGMALAAGWLCRGRGRPASGGRGCALWQPQWRMLAVCGVACGAPSIARGSGSGVLGDWVVVVSTLVHALVRGAAHGAAHPRYSTACCTDTTGQTGARDSATGASYIPPAVCQSSVTVTATATLVSERWCDTGK